MSTFSGIETANRALTTSQGVLDVIGHNLANVNTPGYSRQTVDIEATEPYTSEGLYRGTTPLQVGTGVQMSAITRVQNQFVDDRLLSALGQQGQSDEMETTLNRIQTLYGEPSTSGVSSQLTAFFNSFRDLAGNAESAAMRSTVVEKAKSLALQFNQIVKGMDQVDRDIATRVQSVVDQANDIAKQIASLSDKIHAAVAGNEHPNDLEDQRDELVRKLGTLVGARSVPEVDSNNKPTGYISVMVSDFALVQQNYSGQLPSGTLMTGSTVYLTDGSNDIAVPGGTLGGLIRSGAKLEDYKADLNTTAATLITQVNDQHKLGFGLDGVDQRPFFSGADAYSIAVDTGIVADPSTIAAANPPSGGLTVAPGNGDNASALADISNSQVLGSFTIGDFYASAVSRVGADAKGAAQQSGSDGLVVQQTEALRSSSSGVSMDEELTNMLRYQRSYQAAARILSTINSMFDDLFNTVR